MFSIFPKLSLVERNKNSQLNITVVFGIPGCMACNQIKQTLKMVWSLQCLINVALFRPISKHWHQLLQYTIFGVTKTFFALNLVMTKFLLNSWFLFYTIDSIHLKNANKNVYENVSWTNFCIFACSIIVCILNCSYSLRKLVSKLTNVHINMWIFNVSNLALFLSYLCSL